VLSLQVLVKSNVDMQPVANYTRKAVRLGTQCLLARCNIHAQYGTQAALFCTEDIRWQYFAMQAASAPRRSCTDGPWLQAFCARSAAEMTCGPLAGANFLAVQDHAERAGGLPEAGRLPV
jgi:hypothetical protein